MTQQANDNRARWMSILRSNLMRSPANQAMGPLNHPAMFAEAIVALDSLAGDTIGDTLCA